MTPFLKTCSKCRKQKWSSEFHIHKGKGDGHRSVCKNCDSRKQYNRYTYKGRRNRNLLEIYNITLEDYELMLKSQNGVCAICKRPETIKNKNNKIDPLSVDHCHTTGKIRGLLCRECNRLLGMLEKEKWIEKAKEYLKNN